MPFYVLTEEQFGYLRDYFELALTAVTDEEQDELVFMEKPIRDMLRDLTPAPAQPGTH